MIGAKEWMLHHPAGDESVASSAVESPEWSDPPSRRWGAKKSAGLSLGQQRFVVWKLECFVWRFVSCFSGFLWSSKGFQLIIQEAAFQSAVQACKGWKKHVNCVKLMGLSYHHGKQRNHFLSTRDNVSLPRSTKNCCPCHRAFAKRGTCLTP